jgi:hypothetical protein
MTPKAPTDDWPYERYPGHFAEKRVIFGRPKQISPKEITELTCQGLDKQAGDQLVAVVRPSETFGVSLWGEEGDAEMVELIFRVQPETGQVSVSNQCT